MIVQYQPIQNLGDHLRHRRLAAKGWFYGYVIGGNYRFYQQWHYEHADTFIGMHQQPFFDCPLPVKASRVELNPDGNKGYKIGNLSKLETKNKIVKAPPFKYQEKFRLLSDGVHCRYCERELTLREFTWYHIIPRSKGGLDISENKIPCCPECNTLKGSLDLTVFLSKVKSLPKNGINECRVRNIIEVYKYISELEISVVL